MCREMDRALPGVYEGRTRSMPPRFDVEAYMGRNVNERSLHVLKQWRGPATRYDKLALTYRGGVVLGRSSPGSANWETRPSAHKVREPRLAPGWPFFGQDLGCPQRWGRTRSTSRPG
ncbi:hypothetical protein GCM10009740_32010 [Terrabacter terrae]|uniref:Uncharacterized protein n=1 Tax=Terrabacter terrae TaxID=318434 RepID=A0ABN2UIB9_9MICO